jgi:hypothetical protein
MSDQLLSIQLKLDSMQTELQAMLELDTADAIKEMNKLLDSVRRLKQSLKGTRGEEFAKLVDDINRLEDGIRRAVQAKAAMAHQGRAVSAELDVMKRGISDVQRGLLFIARDAPYGLMGVMNNVEVLIDTLERLKVQAAASGQSFSSLGLILQGLVQLFTSPSGIIALLGILLMSLKDVGSLINRLTSGAFAEFLHFFREIGKSVGFVNDFRTGFEKFKDALEEKVNLENIQTGFKILSLQIDNLEQQNKELEEKIRQRKEILEKAGEGVGGTQSKKALDAEIQALEKKKSKNEEVLLLLKAQVLRQDEFREKLEGELEARNRINAAFRDKAREIKRSYEEELILNEKVRDELLRRRDDLTAKQRKLTAELERQEKLLRDNAIARLDYEDEVLRIRREQASVGRELLEVNAELLRRDSTLRLEADASLARASAMRIRDSLLRQEQLTKIEMSRNARLLELQEKLRRQGAITPQEFEKESASILEAQARLRAELVEIENKKIERNIELRKQALALQVQITEKQKEQAMLEFERKVGQMETVYDTDMSSERVILFQEELIALKKEELELDIRRRKLNNEIFNESAERAKFEVSVMEMRMQLQKRIDEMNAKGREQRKKRYMEVFGGIFRSEEMFLDTEEARGRRDIVQSSIFREDVQGRLNELQIRRLEERIQVARRSLDVAKSLKSPSEEILQAERQLAMLELRLAELQSVQISAMSFLQGFGDSFARAIEQQIQFNSRAAELERERTRQQLEEERRRISERRALLQKEYEDIVSLINEQVGAQQISQAEAAKRLSEFEKKRVDEFEELKRRETEIAEREHRLQAQSFAKMVMVNLTNSVVQLLAQMLVAEAVGGRLNLLTAALVVPATIAATSAIRAMLEGMMVSYAEGRMFDRPTMISAVVGDAQKAGQPVNFEALLNATQLAEFGRRYALEREQAVVVNVRTELNATKLVEVFEEQKLVYQKLRVK